VRDGHAVTLVTSSAFFPEHYQLNGPVTTLEYEGVRLCVLRVPYSNRFGYLRRMVAFVEFAWRSARIAARVAGADLVFATSTPLTIAIPAMFAKNRLRVPMVFEVRDLWPELPVAIGALRNPLVVALARWLERTAYASAARVVALSPGMRQGIISAGCAAEKVVVVPNACDVELFRGGDAERFLRDHPELAGRPLVTYAGTVGPINGVDFLARVAAETQGIQPDIAFVVVGKGRESDRLRAVAQDLGVLGANFFMLPPIPKPQVPSLLAATTLATSLFIDLPSMWHNSANKFFDALAAGRPVLINYGGWQAELLERTGAGLVVSPSDPAGAARRLAEFIRDPTRVAQAGAAARELADGEFNRDRLAGEFGRVLADVVREDRAVG
jgi:glycosyltransferase involved in cell wall biosynthesis